MCDGLDSTSFAGSSQEVEGKRSSEIKTEGAQDLDFHLEDLLLRVGPVCDVDKVLDLGGVDLLVLGGHQHRCHANQLEFAAGNGSALNFNL